MKLLFSLESLVWWRSWRLPVVPWVKGLCSGAGLPWWGHSVSSPLVWLGRSWLDSLSLTLQRCLAFPHLSALRICRVVSDCVPGGPEFPEGMWGVASLGVREAKQLDSGPPALASTRTDLLYCLSLGPFPKSHLKRTEIHIQSILWESRKRESSIHEQN